jgi:hypothetical protein
MFQTDFRDITNIFQGCSKQISEIVLCRFWGYSGHISSALTIMEIDDWTIRSFSHPLFLYCIESKSVVKVVAQNMGFV